METLSIRNSISSTKVSETALNRPKLQKYANEDSLILETVLHQPIIRMVTLSISNSTIINQSIRIVTPLVSETVLYQLKYQNGDFQ